MHLYITCLSLVMLLNFNNFCIGKPESRKDPCSKKGGECLTVCKEREQKDIGTAPNCNGRCCRKYRWYESWKDPCKKLGGFCNGSNAGCYGGEENLGKVQGCSTICCKKIGKLKQIVTPAGGGNPHQIYKSISRQGTRNGINRGINLSRQGSRNGISRGVSLTRQGSRNGINRGVSLSRQGSRNGVANTGKNRRYF